MSPSNLLPILAIPWMEALCINPIINDDNPVLGDSIPSHHILFDHIGDGYDPVKTIFLIRRVFDITLDPLLWAQHPSQEFDDPQEGVIIGFQAPPEPSPMDSSMGLKDICS